MIKAYNLILDFLKAVEKSPVKDFWFVFMDPSRVYSHCTLLKRLMCRVWGLPLYLDAEPAAGETDPGFYRQSNFNHFCFIGIFIGVQVQEVQN